jgi:hypothetical protein
MIKMIRPRRRVRSQARIDCPIVVGTIAWQGVFECTGWWGTMIEVLCRMCRCGGRIFAPLQNISFEARPRVSFSRL